MVRENRQNRVLCEGISERCLLAMLCAAKARIRVEPHIVNCLSIAAPLDGSGI